MKNLCGLFGSVNGANWVEFIAAKSIAQLYTTFQFAAAFPL